MHYLPAPFRLLRTATIGATILSLAAAAHMLAGGVLPAPSIMAALMALHILCSIVATKFQLGLPAMMGLLATSQLVLHQAFDTFSVSIHTSVATESASSLASMHQHGGSADAYAAMLPDAGALGMVHHGVAMSAWMLAAHIGATLAAAVLLAQGENALWALAAWLRPLYRSAAVVLLLLPARETRPGLAPLPQPFLPWRNVRPNTRRGPPSFAATFA